MSAADIIRRKAAMHLVAQSEPVPMQVIAPIVTPNQAEPRAALPPISEAIQAEVKAAKDEANTETHAQCIEALNQNFFIAPWGSAVRVFHETHDHELDRPTLAMYTPDALRLLLRNKTVMTTDEHRNTKRVPLADAWMASSNRREYPNGIALLPNLPTPAGVFNLYRGLGIEAQGGDVKPALRHITDVICDGDKRLASYVVKWCARAVQRPELPAEVALVLKGGRGTGKGTLGRWLLKIFGAHGLQISQSRHLTGNFNGHLRDCLLLFADESFFAGDKSSESVLKALITEDTLAIERKGVDVIAAKNRLKVLMASNAEWVAPAGPDERRFCAIKVSDCHKQDHAYFATLADQMENGGLAAFLDFLLKLDLSGFNVRAVPSTKELEAQKILSLPPLASWLYARLQEGRLTMANQGWETKQPRDLLCADFAEYVKARGLRHVHTDSAVVGRQLREIIPAIEDAREASGQRRRLWIFPAEESARNAFASYAKLEHVAWAGDDDAE